MKTNITPHEPLPLAEALRIARGLHVAIIPTSRSVKLWAPGVRVPGVVRQTIQANRVEVRRLIGQAHISTCCAPELHRASWDYINRRWCCDLCARLNYWQEQAARDEQLGKTA